MSSKCFICSGGGSCRRRGKKVGSRTLTAMMMCSLTNVSRKKKIHHTDFSISVRSCLVCCMQKIGGLIDGACVSDAEV